MHPCADTCFQAVVTRYLGPTNTRGARIKATCSAGSVTVPYDHELPSDFRSHWPAVAKLIRQLDWPQKGWVPGGMPANSRDSYVFVNRGRE